MSGVRKIARRTFLVGSAAIAGGVAFGVRDRRAVANPLCGDVKTGRVPWTPYIRLDHTGVTIITPRADVGQGAYSVLAALVAEELDLAWKDVKFDPGEPSPDYYNGKVLEESARFFVANSPLAGIPSGFSNQIEAGAAGVASWAAKLLGLQMTGGSSTVADAYEKMRVAAAMARECILLAAAQEWGVSRAGLDTKDGEVIRQGLPPASYASLAQAVAKIDLPSEVKLKCPHEWRYLGSKQIQRIDMVAKCTGTAVYGIDLKMDGMVYATVRTNPRPGGGLKNAAAVRAAAEASKGVRKVVLIENDDGVIIGLGVIANNTWRAFKAAEVITEEDWGPAPYPEKTTAEMFDKVAESFNGQPDSTTLKSKNNVDAALAAGAAGVIDAKYAIPYLAHAPLEPMNAVVQLKDGHLDIWTGTQIPMWLVRNAARQAGLAVKNVHLHAQFSGGSFGRRLEDDYVYQAVQLAVEYQNCPIKMTWTRKEDMTHDFPRPLAIAQMKGAVKDGHVYAYDLGIASPSVTRSQPGRQKISIGGVNLPFFTVGPDVFIVAGAYDQPYQIPNYRVTGYRAPEMVPVSSWRSVGASGNAFFHECFLDELIHEAGADPLAERLRLCSDDPSVVRVLEKVGEMSNWGSDPGANRGRGLAFTHSFGVPVAEVVEVTNRPDGIKIDKVFVAVDAGPVLDPENFENQIQGGVIWGLGHAMNAELTYNDGMPEQTNYDGFEGMRFYQAPGIECWWPPYSDSEIRGMGEPSVPPAAPALANAIFAATGKVNRIRKLPLNKSVKFV